MIMGRYLRCPDVSKRRLLPCRFIGALGAEGRQTNLLTPDWCAALQLGPFGSSTSYTTNSSALLDPSGSPPPATLLGVSSPSLAVR